MQVANIPSQECQGQLTERGALIRSVSTGKTTISVNSHNLVAPEGVEILQDDINMLTTKGNSYGTEKTFM